MSRDSRSGQRPPDIEMIPRRSQRHDRIIKLLLVGGQGVGKTSFLRRFADMPFRPQYVPTVCLDMIVIPYGEYEGSQVHLHFWDISYTELEASPSHHALLFTGVSGVFYMLDVSSQSSLVEVDRWHQLLQKYVDASVPRLLLAHKADLPRSSYVVNDRILERYVKDAGLIDWCWTVGHADFGDYVSTRGLKSLSVAEAVHILVERAVEDKHMGATGPVIGLDDSLSYSSRRLLGPSYQPLQGWLPSTDLMALLRQHTSGSQALVPKRKKGKKLVESPISYRPMVDRAIGDPAWDHFAGSIGREEAERILRRRPMGTFLLRRKDPTSLVLSVKRKTAVEHALIVYEDGAYTVNNRRHETLTAFLEGVSKYAVKGLRFRRLLNSNKYMVVEEDDYKATEDRYVGLGRSFRGEDWGRGPPERGREEEGEEEEVDEDESSDGSVAGSSGEGFTTPPRASHGRKGGREGGLAREILGLFGDLEGIALSPRVMCRLRDGWSEQGEMLSDEQGEQEEAGGAKMADQEEGRQVLLATAKETKRMLLETLGEDRLGAEKLVSSPIPGSPTDLAEAIEDLEARMVRLMRASIVEGSPHGPVLVRSLSVWRAFLQTVRVGLE